MHEICLRGDCSGALFASVFILFVFEYGTVKGQFTSKPQPPECPALEGGDLLTQSDFLWRLSSDCRYDKLLRPGEGQLQVHARSYIYFIQPADAHDLNFKLHFLLQLRWVDPRLSYSTYSPERERIIGEEQLRSRVWIPHIYLSNEQSSSIMGTDSKNVLMTIAPDGEVLFSRRMQAVLYCWMNLAKFPFDRQICSLNMESWMYNASDLKMLWETDLPVTLSPQLHLTEYALLDHWTNQSIVQGDLINQKHGGSGNFSSIKFSFKLQREVGYYLMDYFIPSMMIVAISWVSFWLQADQSAPRITLGTSTMLSFITLASSQAKTLPKVSYIKASEIWFLGCTGFIFGSLVEFAFVNCIWRRKKNVELKKVNSKYILKSTLTPRLARKELQKEFLSGNLTKSHSCSSLNDSETDSRADGKSQNNFNNYLTVHSFPSQLNLPTITTQSFDDLLPPVEGPQGLRSRTTGSTTIPVDGSGENKHPGHLPHLPHPHFPTPWTTMTPQEIATWIDTRSRYIFPLAFVIYNAIYWTYVYVF